MRDAYVAGIDNKSSSNGYLHNETFWHYRCYPDGMSQNKKWQGGAIMKTKVVVVLLSALLTLLVINPAPSYAGGHGYNGWAVGGAFVGGAVLGTVLGSALAAPRYIPAPQPVVAYPEPAYAPEPYAYAYPAPVYAYAPPGQWVVVPGRWVYGRWVPPHRVWHR
jgi:hypothetical protein